MAKTPKKRCKNCLYWVSKICHNPHIRIGESLADRCKGCKKDIWLNNEGADVGKNVRDMEEIVRKVIMSMFLQTGKNFCCCHWKSKYEGVT